MPQLEPYNERLLSLESAIDRRPLTVSPDTSIKEAIWIIGKAQSSCVLPSLDNSFDSMLGNEARAGAIFVMEGTRLLGRFAKFEAIEAILSGKDLTKISVTEAMVREEAIPSESNESDIFTVLSLLRQHQLDWLPIVDERKQLEGTITLASIRKVLPVDELLKSRQLARMNSDRVIQVSSNSSALNLARVMSEQRVDRAVIVSEENEQPLGTVSLQDIILLYTLEVNLAEMEVGTIMASPLLCYSPSTTFLVAYWEMQQKMALQFVVADASGKISSIVTPTSFLQTLDLSEIRATVEEIQRSIEQFALDKVRLPPKNLDRKALVKSNPEELLQQLECSRILTEIALHIRESLDLDRILQTAVDEVRKFLKTDRAIVYRFNPDFSGTVVVESVAPQWQSVLNATVKDTCFGQNYARAYQEGRIQVTEDIYTAGLTQCHIDILVLFDIRASLVVPILQGKELWGLLCSYHCSQPRQWQQFEISLLMELATHIAIAIQQSELYQQVQAELNERKRAEEQLKESLKEKEILLKEIHHRVKNNLQVISSVLRLQSDYIKDEKALALFRDSQNRIRSMALIHEKLYQSKNLSRIDFGEYIRDLTSNLLRSYCASPQTVNLRISTEEVWLNIDTAIPCALIVNELVSNSLKHAFPIENENNEVYISVSKTDDDRYVLIVRDNGVGFSPDLYFKSTNSFGLELVRIFGEQLQANIELEISNGTNFTITFL